MIRAWTCVGLLIGLIAVSGCGQNPTDNAGGTKEAKEVAKAVIKTGEKASVDPSAEDGGEWCNPHGILEEECSMCSAKAAKDFKAKGDWCDKHDRAKSQCFICDPTLMEKAKLTYQARYGKEMPTPRENMPAKQ